MSEVMIKVQHRILPRFLGFALTGATSMFVACSPPNEPGGHQAPPSGGASGASSSTGGISTGGSGISGTTSTGGSGASAGSATTGGSPSLGGSGGSDATGGTIATGGTGGTGGSMGGAGNGGDGGPGGAGAGGASGGGALGGAGAGGKGGLPDPGTDGDGDFTVGPTYTTQPDLTDRGAPKGKSFMFTMRLADSQIFDGTDATLDAGKVNTQRTINVYVPAQYTAGTPAPLLVIQDGPGELSLVRNALDNLTIVADAARKLPPFVVVAVQNGGSDSKGSERGLEYDTMSDRYARFIDTEVLPAVENNSQLKAAYPNFKFTKDPNGRGSLGCSSGGAAALTMGWFRSDLFRRLVTYSGTFVDQQDDDAPEEVAYPLGAWEYHSSKSLIANTDKKEFRIFLNANENDNGSTAAESGHHNWVIANQRTAAALKAKGYHYRYVVGLGEGHCSGNVKNATLADALIWVWRGYQASGQ